MSVVRHCTRFESIPPEATRVVKLWGPNGYYNENTNLPYLYEYEIPKDIDKYIEYLIVEKKLEKFSEETESFGIPYTKIDFRKMFPHSTPEEFAEEFYDEWRNTVYNMDSYIERFHDREYKEYCKEMDEIEANQKTEYDLWLEEQEEEEFENNHRNANSLINDCKNILNKLSSDEDLDISDNC